jgi:peptidoglycan hydrolase-like protein with peptidoglycan-binding domain
VKLVADVQHALSVRKLYRGAADGIAGSRTRAAIAAYERSAGLPVTGIATADLLTRLRTPARQLAAAKLPPAAVPPVAAPAIPPAPAAAAPAIPPQPVAARQALEAIAAPPAAEPAVPVAEVAPAPPPPPAARQAIEPVAAPQAPDPVAPAADEESDSTPAVDTPPIQAAAPLPAVAPPAAAAPPASPPPAAAAPRVAAAQAAAPDPALGDRQRYRKVQDALNQAGYGPLPTDGIANDETASAIRRFELDNGLAITGRPSDRVAARLVSIGAMQAN